MFTLESRGRVLHAGKPLVMGILNCTDDSFYAESRSLDPLILHEKIDGMVQAGVDIIDIGGQSTKPGTVQIPEEEEIIRITPAIQYIAEKHPLLWMSIDTTRSSVAKHAVEKGVHVVNDISAGNMDENMIKTVAKLRVPFVCMHMQGTPETMQDHPHYTDLVAEVLLFFDKKTKECHAKGIKQVILDPGFGFGKTLDHNYMLTKELHQIVSLGYPVLVGYSRKSMVYKMLECSPQEALNGTTVLNTHALFNGAGILRVHDVKEAKEAVNIFIKIQQA